MKKIIFTLIVLCLYITSVSAYQMALTGSDDIDKSLDISLDLTDLVEYESFYGLTANLNYDENKLELLDISGNDKLNLAYSAKTKRIVIYNATGIKETASIIKFKFKNIGLNQTDETEIKVDNIVATDSKKDIPVADVTKTVKAISNGTTSNNYLTDIKINGQSLEFDKNELNYEIVVSNDTTKIDVNALANNKDITILGNGSYNLEEGNNKIKVTVQDGEDTKTYTINVNRENSNSNINEEDLFIKSKKFKWNNLYFIPIGLILLILTILIIKKKKGNK